MYCSPQFTHPGSRRGGGEGRGSPERSPKRKHESTRTYPEARGRGAGRSRVRSKRHTTEWPMLRLLLIYGECRWLCRLPRRPSPLLHTWPFGALVSRNCRAECAGDEAELPSWVSCLKQLCGANISTGKVSTVLVRSFPCLFR